MNKSYLRNYLIVIFLSASVMYLILVYITLAYGFGPIDDELTTEPARKAYKELT